MAKKQLAAPSAPFWLVTFSDMMSLLVCFFVLIISFSTTDQKRFYEVTGSLKDAFGVDTVSLLTKIVEVDGVPFLKQDRRLIPLPMAVVATARVTQEGDVNCGEGQEGNLSPQTEFEDVESATDQATAANWSLADLGMQETEQENDPVENPEAQDQTPVYGRMETEITERSRPVQFQGKPEMAERDPSDTGPHSIVEAPPRQPQNPRDTTNPDALSDPRLVEDPDAIVQESAPPDPEMIAARREIAERLNAILAPEVEEGLLTVEERQGEITVTFPSTATFASGSDAIISQEMLVAIDRVADVVSTATGEIQVIGHTDNVPINTARFPSNWELSAFRAISVLRRLEARGSFDRGRLSVMGMADTEPVAPNDTVENRARNRRVEIVIRNPT